MNIHKATNDYEVWLGKQLKLVPGDLASKHAQMSDGPFPFLRATFYRWMQVWPEVCKECDDAPKALAVGDLHVENFGTWRDAEGRLVWGINDFDEAYSLPYTLDLVRLAASAVLAQGHHSALDARRACDAIVSGYRECLRVGGRPFVLSDRHPWLSTIAASDLREPGAFWQRMKELPAVSEPMPKDAAAAIETLMPQRGLRYRVVRRMKGLGSLGHQRFIALADHHGGLISREAKALSASACAWAADQPEAPIQYEAILAAATRCPDPLVKVFGKWLVRRLAPDCSRIELASLSRVNDQARLLHAMGWETANVHRGTAGADKLIRRDLKQRPRRWLRDAVKAMLKATMKDWQEWREPS